MFDVGKGVAQDYQEAAKWYHLAAEQGYSEAKYKLAHIYENKKKKLLIEAAAQNHQGAQKYLDTHYKRKQIPTTNNENTSKRSCIDRIGEL